MVATSMLGWEIEESPGSGDKLPGNSWAWSLVYQLIGRLEFATASATENKPPSMEVFHTR